MKLTHFFVSVLIGLIILMWTLAGYAMGYRDMHKEAVKNGVAEWVLVTEPGPNAEFEFQWIKPEVK